jgi:hypothetical protein
MFTFLSMPLCTIKKLMFRFKKKVKKHYHFLRLPKTEPFTLFLIITLLIIIRIYILRITQNLVIQVPDKT